MKVNGHNHATNGVAVIDVKATRAKFEALWAERVAMLKGLAKNETKLVELGVSLAKAKEPEFCPFCGRWSVHDTAPHDDGAGGKLVLHRCEEEHTWRTAVVETATP